MKIIVLIALLIFSQNLLSKSSKYSPVNDDLNNQLNHSDYEVGENNPDNLVPLSHGILRKSSLTGETIEVCRFDLYRNVNATPNFAIPRTSGVTSHFFNSEIPICNEEDLTPVVEIAPVMELGKKVSGSLYALAGACALGAALGAFDVWVMQYKYGSLFAIGATVIVGNDTGTSSLRSFPRPTPPKPISIKVGILCAIGGGLMVYYWG